MIGGVAAAACALFTLSAVGVLDFWTILPRIGALGGALICAWLVSVAMRDMGQD